MAEVFTAVELVVKVGVVSVVVAFFWAAIWG